MRTTASANYVHTRMCEFIHQYEIILIAIIQLQGEYKLIAEVVRIILLYNSYTAIQYIMHQRNIIVIMNTTCNCRWIRSIDWHRMHVMQLMEGIKNTTSAKLIAVGTGHEHNLIVSAHVQIEC